MNNNIVKNLRQTMLSIAAAAVVSIGFTACSEETFMAQNAAAPANGYQVSIPASIGGGETRAIAFNSETGGYDATFETTDEIFVYDVNQGGMSNGHLNPDAVGRSANLVGKLTTFIGRENKEVVPRNGDELLLLYKDVNFDYSRDFSSDRDKEPDYALAKVTITSINDGAITTSPATFVNHQSIYKINFTGIGSDVKIKKMRISSANGKLVESCYPYNEDPDNYGDVTYTYKDEGSDQHELTFLLRFATNPYNQSNEPGDVITFTAVGSNGHNYMGTKAFTDDLENGKYYHADVTMEDMGLAMTVKNITKGVTLAPSTYCNISTKEADYFAENNGYGTCIEWFGANDNNHTFTIKDLTMYNSKDVAIAVKTAFEDPDNTKVHNLILDGVNTLSVTGYLSSITVQKNCSLNISAPSTGKLILKAEEGLALNMWDNAKVTIESGEVTLDGSLGGYETSSCIISKSGKLRILKDSYIQEGLIKAASGYVLNVSSEGNYTVYTVTAAPAYEQPKALSEATTSDIGKIIGSDGKVHVPNWDLPAGVSPVAMIASISSTGHGLAIAMDNVKKYNEWGDPNPYFTWDASGTNNQGLTAIQIFDEWVVNNGVNFGTWRMPTKTDWQTMILSCRIDGDATEPNDYSMTPNGISAKLTEAGIFYRSDFYSWTNTQIDDDVVFMYIAKGEDGSVAVFNQASNAVSCVHPVLEF